MKRIKRILLAVAALFVLLVVVAGVWLWHPLGKPLYQPGMVLVGANLRGSLDPPPQQDSDGFWTVEPDIRLHHFSQGQGRPVLVLHGGPGYPITKALPGLEPLTAKFRFHYYDQRGCGQSSRPFDRLTSKNFYANMTELERTLGIGAQVADIERIRRILKVHRLVSARGRARPSARRSADADSLHGRLRRSHPSPRTRADEQGRHVEGRPLQPALLPHPRHSRPIA